MCSWGCENPAGKVLSCVGSHQQGSGALWELFQLSWAPRGSPALLRHMDAFSSSHGAGPCCGSAASRASAGAPGGLNLPWCRAQHCSSAPPGPAACCLASVQRRDPRGEAGCRALVLPATLPLRPGGASPSSLPPSAWSRCPRAPSPAPSRRRAAAAAPWGGTGGSAVPQPRCLAARIPAGPRREAAPPLPASLAAAPGSRGRNPGAPSGGN